MRMCGFTLDVKACRFLSRAPARTTGFFAPPRPKTQALTIGAGEPSPEHCRQP